MAFKIVTPGYEEEFERWTDALEKANSMKSALKSWFKDIRILEDGKPVWVFGRGRSHPEYLGPGTYDRLARLFITEAQAEAKAEQMWTLRGKEFIWGDRTYLMGVLNVTPDSFSDGGEFNTVETALAQAKNLVAAEIDILDIGGQSSRPGSKPTTLEEERDRVIPVIQAIRSAEETALKNIPISVDTTRAQVARAALEAGADIINDISSGTYDPEIFKVTAKFNAPIMLMHLRGTPETMQQMTNYDNLMQEIVQFLAQQADKAVEAGIDPKKIVVDPGIGFAKTVEQNVLILQQLEALKVLNCPILVGTSRKSFIGKILNRPDAKDRVWGTAATCSCAIAHGADILRVHDGPQMRDVCRMADELWRPLRRTSLIQSS